MHGLSFEVRAEGLTGIEHLSRVIAWHLNPFRLAGLTVKMQGDLDRKLILTTTTFPDHPFEFNPDDVGTSDAYVVWTEFGLAAAKYFASIYTAPEKNIVLGEN